jgi:hypothetical protein
MTNRLVWAALATVAAMAGTANAQDAGPVVIHREVVRAIGGASGDVMYHPDPIGMEFLGAEMSFSDKPVKGAPYAAEAVTETTQTLADGNRITRKSSANVYRDSAGRTRREETMSAMGPWAAGGDAPKVIFIQDPAASAGYHLDPQTHVAHKMPMGKGAFFFSQTGTVASGQKNVTFQRMVAPPAGAEVSGAVGAVAIAAPGAKISKADVKTESLGKQTIDMSRRSDPRFGETVYRLTNIQRSEQPASLFEVPPDYTVAENEFPPMMKKIQTAKPVEEGK